MSVTAARPIGVLRAHVGRNVIVWIALLILVVAIVCAVFAPWLAPHDPQTQQLGLRLRPPFWSDRAAAGHLLGTDDLGRDMLSRVLYGSRVSILVGVCATVLAGFTGVLIGLFAGYFGGWQDAVLMRLADIQLAFPSILFALALVAVLGSGVTYVVLVLGFTGWVSYARVVRGEVLRLRERDFVTAARAVGVRDLTTIRRHILPNVMAPLATIGTLQVASMIIIESSLSYLGLGVPKSVPTWGGMLDEGQLFLSTAWWVAVIPGVAITLVALSINILGDVLRDVADPKAYRR